MNLKHKILFIFIINIIILLLFELFLRLIKFNYYQSGMHITELTKERIIVDKKIPYYLKPNITFSSNFFKNIIYRTNETGLRTNNLEYFKNKKIILCCGDSRTFGWASEKSYSDYLNEIICKDYAVLNAGIPGYSSKIGLNFYKYFLKDKLKNFNIKLFILSFGWNDSGGAKLIINPEDKFFYYKYKVHNILINFRIYHFVLKLCKYYDLKIMHKNLFKPRVPLENFKKNLEQWHSIASEMHIPIIMLTLTSPDSNMNSIIKNYNYVIKNMSSKKNFFILDLEYYLKNEKEIYSDVIHYNDKGNKIIAQLLNDFIKKNNLLCPNDSK